MGAYLYLPSLIWWPDSIQFPFLSFLDSLLRSATSKFAISLVSWLFSGLRPEQDASPLCVLIPDGFTLPMAFVISVPTMPSCIFLAQTTSPFAHQTIPLEHLTGISNVRCIKSPQPLHLTHLSSKFILNVSFISIPPRIISVLTSLFLSYGLAIVSLVIAMILLLPVSDLI